MPTAPLDPARLAQLRVLLDRLIPADEASPGGWDAGGGDYIQRLLAGDLADRAGDVVGGLDGLEAEARARHRKGFGGITAAEQDAIIAEAEAGRTTVAWPVEARRAIALLVNLANEGYWSDPSTGGNRGEAGWKLIGYRPQRQAPPAERPWAVFPPNPPPPPAGEPWDAIVIGAGAGGGIVAGLLAERGQRVLLVERGRRQTHADTGRDHLRNHRLALYDFNTGPAREGNPRVAVAPDGSARVVRPFEGGYQHNASAVGGGTLVYGAQAWRFMPQDFRMASTYGVPAGSSLADWPLDYAELAPYYERAEWEVGVSGDGAAHGGAWPRARGYPMPPVPENPQRRVLMKGAESLGWIAAPAPLAINTAPHLGRAACGQCDNCIGFTCPTDAKNGSFNTLIPRGLATGKLTLLTGTVAERIDTDAKGRVTGVSLVSEVDGAVVRRSERATTVVVACAAIESARLLLNSTSDKHPRGLGNSSDQVGRHLQGHYYPSATGLFAEPLFDGRGPGVSVATVRFNHGNPGIVGGSMLANEFVKMPMMFWRGSLPGDQRRWGAGNKAYMRDNYTRVVQVQGPVQEIPSPDSRVTLDPEVRDRWGIPVARLSGTTHPETLRTAAFMRARSEEWLRASGAQRIWGHTPGLNLSAGQHQAGSCRMGDDPATSVVDRWGRVHGHDNLFVADGAVHVTNGGFNPVLTIMALAFRLGEHIPMA